jgi:broad specificity phosphatase PhoE
MSDVFVITHPEVTIDPARAIDDWGLSKVGADRAACFASNRILSKVELIWTSGERKAVETATLISSRLKKDVRKLSSLHENDRTATGYLPKEEFELMADAFFASPGVSVRGWERAVDAQERIVMAVEQVLADSPPGDLAVVTHGAVGTLLYCAYANCAISRSYDQPFQGHFWRFERETRAIVHGWQPIAPRDLPEDQG